jgi:L-cysteine:1D-myo-inositol 2-amino-2-deoxy-alpha-D-glucopyranoside ligase
MRAWPAPDLPALSVTAPPVRVFDTSTGALVETRPEGAARMYVCGITPYDATHMGHAATFVGFDLLNRAWRNAGHEVVYVQNVTDVDDPLFERADKVGIGWRELAARETQLLREDMAALRLVPPDHFPGAEESLDLIVALIRRLQEAGAIYQVDDDLYFSVGADPGFGDESGWTREQMLEVFADRGGDPDRPGKKDPLDCLVWRAQRPGEPSLDSELGPGRPGWHVECSAMALALIRRHLGTEVLDIHAGGVDLIFPHHEDEIAQSCAYTGRDEFARVWLHGEFLNIRGEKMSKRFGNITTARDLREDGVDPGAVRLLMFQVHYRQKLDLTDEALAAAQEGSRRLGQFQRRLLDARAEADGPGFEAASDRLDRELTEALNDDLNAPRAIAALFGFVTAGNAALDAGERPGPRAVAAWQRAEGILGVTSAVRAVRITPGTGAEVGDLPEAPPHDPSGAEEWARAWALRRKQAKSGRDFAEADRIRGLLREAGWEVRDNKDGSVEVVGGGRS